MKKNNRLVSSMDTNAMLDGTKFIADSVFDDENSKDI